MSRAGGVPAHFWLPDVTEGTSAPAVAFVTTGPNIGALTALFRLLAAATVNRPMLLAVLAAPR
jgi:NADH-quinone oxidoreductase subunit N